MWVGGFNAPALEGALVTSAVVAFAQATPSPGHQVRLTAGGSLAEPEQSRVVDVATLAPAARWSGWPVEAAPAGAATALGDLFTIRRGIAMGSNRLFVMPRSGSTASGTGFELAEAVGRDFSG